MLSVSSCNNVASRGMVVSSLILFHLTLLCFSFPAVGIPSRSLVNNNGENLFAEKYFLNIENGSITLITRNNSLGPVLEEIGRRTGKKIQISPALRSKKISLRWKNVSFEEGIEKMAEESGQLFGIDEEGKLSLSELNSDPESADGSVEINNKGNPHANYRRAIQAKPSVISPAGDFSSKAVFSQKKDLEDNSVLNEMVIRFKQDISEKDIDQFLSDSNIKVKKYIAALKYHILSLPEGMTSYDAMLLFKRKQMLYQAEPDYIVPVK